MTQSDRPNLPESSVKRESVQQMFDRISNRYDFVNRVLTLRMDVRWRRLLSDRLNLKPNDVVLDLASGTGDFAKLLNERRHRAIGIDLSAGMLEHASSDFIRVQGDLLSLGIQDDSVDACVSGFALRNLTDLEPFFTECARVLKPGGRLGVLEVSKPSNRLLAAGHKFYFNKVVPKLGSLLSDKSAYAYLPESTAYLPETADLVAMMQRSGFTDCYSKQMSGGIAQILVGTKG